ncbi:MAG: N-acetyltransferase [Leptolinea sp.]|jgi:acetyltransferase-like isoleucine patch superfamily enzyme|nr:N-acetyltransferase [Leptolinea sp.]
MSDFFSHSTAIVETEQIGSGTRIWAYAHVMKEVQIGSNCNIGDHSFIESGVVVGNNVTIKNGNMLFEGLVLEDGVFVGPHVFFTNDLHPRSPRLPQAKMRYKSHDWLYKTLVKRGASLGAGAVILADTTIGEYALVGAGCVVSHDVPAYALVVGNPARQIGWVCECGITLKEDGQTGVCPSCSRRYHIKDQKISPL